MVSIASSSNIAITGGIFTINQINQNFSNASEKLSREVSSRALHDGPARSEATRCYHGTRTDVLDGLEKWLEGVILASPPVLWLYGGAGAGKSAIMQTLSERWIPQGRALGAFFFSRTDETRNTATALVPTLAYQLARLYPTAMDILGPIIDSDPLVLKKPVETQTVHLLVPPLKELIRTGNIQISPGWGNVFLIDGLDECTDLAEQQAVIKSIRAILHNHGIPVKFLVSSRPEQTISSTFDLNKKYCAFKTLSLSNHEGSERDIRHFIVSEFGKICASHLRKDLIPSNWPPETAVTALVRKSSSHFIYAATAMKYIASLHEDPVRSLDVVLGLQVARYGTVYKSLFPDLDMLYSYILGKAAHRDRVLQILAHCIFSTLPRFVDMIALVNDCSSTDIHIFLGDVAALVFIKMYPGQGGVLDNEDEVRLLHASLGDFLRDKARAGLLYIDEIAYHQGMLEQKFKLLDRISRGSGGTISPKWPITHDRGFDYSRLGAEIFMSIHMSVNTRPTQELIKKYGLREFHKIQYRFNFDEYEFAMGSVEKGLFAYMDTIRFSNIGDEGRLYRVFLEDFFDIFESYLLDEIKPLAPAILPLIFFGYPTNKVRDILSHFQLDSNMNDKSPISQLLMEPCWPYMTPKNGPEKRSMGVFDNLDPSDIRAIRQNENASPERIAIAAETILKYVFSKAHTPKKLHIRTPHRRWMQRRKPGIYVATGSPKLASAFHLKFLHHNLSATLLPKDNPPRGKKTNYLGLIPRTSSYFFDPVTLYFLLLDAVFSLLLQAGYSDRLLKYTRKVLPRSTYQRFPKLARRLQRRFDAYSVRVRDLRMREPSHQIDCGSMVALMERIRLFTLDLQD